MGTKKQRAREQAAVDVLRQRSAPAPKAAGDGRGRPKRTEAMVRLVVLLPPELKARLERHAADESAKARRSVTLSGIVQAALDKHLPRG